MKFLIAGLVAVFVTLILMILDIIPVPFPTRGEGMTDQEYLLSEFPWKDVKIRQETLERRERTNDAGAMFGGFFDGADGTYRFEAAVVRNRGGWFVHKAYCLLIPKKYLNLPERNRP